MQLYIESASRLVYVYWSANPGKIHVTSAEVNGSDQLKPLPALTSQEARNLAQKILDVADEFDQVNYEAS